MAQIVNLPPHIIEHIFTFLQYKELDKVRCVCHYFYEIGINRMKTGIEAVLDDLALKIALLEEKLVELHQTLDEKITLNQTLTTLRLLRMHVYSLYILRRHFLMPQCHFTQFGGILDNITQQLLQMKPYNCFNWLQYCLTLQNIISRFNIYNGNITGNQMYPFGVHVIDILDVLTGINYDISCVYNFKTNSCTIEAYYYTENIKFLTYMPDINFIKDCQDRYLTSEERLSILKYLLALVNLYNGLHGKKEEYEREMQFASNDNLYPQHVKRPVLGSYSCRQVTIREYLSPNEVLEKYESRQSAQKALLNCKVHLFCSMDAAPFKIMKSLELLKRDLYLHNSPLLSHDTCSNNHQEVKYFVDINLQFIIKHKMQELFDISIKDGDY